MLPQPLSAILESQGYERIELLRTEHNAYVVRCALKGIVLVTTTVAVMPHARELRVREARLIRELGQHPNILRLLSATDDANTSIHTWPYVGTLTVHHRIERRKGRPLPESFARHLFLQVIGALEHLHRMDYVHRNLTCENLLLDGPESDVILLHDFTQACMMRRSSEKMLEIGFEEDSYEVPQGYAAPECLAGGNRFGPKVDVWMAGLVLYALVTGRLPSTHPEDYERIRQGCIWLPITATKCLCDLVRGMLQCEPAKRLSLAQVRRHAWSIRAHSRRFSASDTSATSHVTKAPTRASSNDQLKACATGVVPAAAVDKKSKTEAAGQWDVADLGDEQSDTEDEDDSIEERDASKSKSKSGNATNSSSSSSGKTPDARVTSDSGSFAAVRAQPLKRLSSGFAAVMKSAFIGSTKKTSQ